MICNFVNKFLERCEHESTATEFCTIHNEMNSISTFENAVDYANDHSLSTLDQKFLNRIFLANPYNLLLHPKFFISAANCYRMLFDSELDISQLLLRRFLTKEIVLNHLIIDLKDQFCLIKVTNKDLYKIHFNERCNGNEEYIACNEIFTELLIKGRSSRKIEDGVALLNFVAIAGYKLNSSSNFKKHCRTNIIKFLTDNPNLELNADTKFFVYAFTGIKMI